MNPEATVRGPELSRVEAVCKRAADVSPAVAGLSTEAKDAALAAMAQGLLDSRAELSEANAADLDVARRNGTKDAVIDRLALTDKRMAAMADGLRAVAAQPDPVGEVVSGWKRPNGLSIQRVRVPLGVVAVIYEARPNVTADVAGLCLKSGNAAILRGSSSALTSNKAIVEVLRKAAAGA
ncbi:MAG: gamma-glutamyl-phosphate reductase, partial [Actinomycetota bacterium]|nr:gamma-glutamyl-phosphate reductase [Actinomycetota bacterium]